MGATFVGRDVGKGAMCLDLRTAASAFGKNVSRVVGMERNRIEHQQVPTFKCGEDVWDRYATLACSGEEVKDGPMFCE
jgi:hypothetical protein